MQAERLAIKLLVGKREKKGGKKQGNRETQKCFSKLPQKCQKIIIKNKTLLSLQEQLYPGSGFCNKTHAFVQIYVHQKKKLNFYSFYFIRLFFFHSFIHFFPFSFPKADMQTNAQL